MSQLPPDLLDRVLSRYPLPIADAVGNLAATDSLHERRDRVVEVFRSGIRFMGALTLAARIQFGPGKGGDSQQIQNLLRSLRRQGLTDGQWVGLSRELTRPFSSAPNTYPIPELVTLFHHSRPWQRTLEALLKMRKSETIAHGTTGDENDLRKLLAQRMPHLVDFLEAIGHPWERLNLLAPLPHNAEDSTPQRARLLMGDTPSRGRWRRMELAPGLRVPPKELILVDLSGKPILGLSPLTRLRSPSPDSIEEVFLLDGNHRKKGLFVAFPSMAEYREEGVWETLTPLLLQENDTLAAQLVDGLSRPYRGLESFDPKHATLFFGREQESEALANRIRRHPIVTVTGPSGSGKSSLLKAGVIPLMGGYRVAIIRPGSDPTLSLIRHLTDLLQDDPLAETLHTFAHQPEKLAACLHQNARTRAEPILILFDQTEEVFTLCRDKETQALFAKHLACLGADPLSMTRVVLSVREDFFSRLATLTPLRGVYSREVEVITTPDREALMRTVVLPAQHFSYHFEDLAMVEDMVTAVEGEPAALTLLQFCADRLWESRDRTWKRLTIEAYQALGGVEGALASHADKVLAGLTPAQQNTARSLLLRLVTGELTRAVVPRTQLLEASESPQDATQVLDRFIDARLLILRESEVEGGEAILELAHEALIRHWERLQEWLAEDKEGRRLQISLQRAAQSWQERGRSRGLLWRGDALTDYRGWRRRTAIKLTEVEQSFVDASLQDAKRLKLWRRSLLGGIVLGSVALSLLLFGLLKRAEDAEGTAVRQVGQLLASSALGDIREHNANRGILLSLEAIRILAEADKDSQGAKVTVAQDSLFEAMAMSRGAYLRNPGGDAMEFLKFSEDGTHIQGRTTESSFRWSLTDPTILHTTPRPPRPPSSAKTAGAPKKPPSATLSPLSLKVQGQEDGTIHLTSPRFSRHLEAHRTGSKLTALALHPTGDFLSAAWADGSVWLWNLQAPKIPGGPCALVARNLSPLEWQHYLPSAIPTSTCPDVPKGVPPEFGQIQLTLPGVDGQVLWVNGLRHSLPEKATSTQLLVDGDSRQHLRVGIPGCNKADVAIAHVFPGGLASIKLGATCSGAVLPLPGVEPEWVSLRGGPMSIALAKSAPVQLKLPDFRILKTPVTVAQYKQCADQGLCPAPTDMVLKNPGCNINDPAFLDHAMNCIPWDDAQQYCAQINARLPSEAEWAFAARSGGKNTLHPWGNETATCARAIMDDGQGIGCGQGRTWAVCSLEEGQSEQGVCDLVGGLYEWLGDCFHSDGGMELGPQNGLPFVTQCEGSAKPLLGGALDDKAPMLAQGVLRIRASPKGKAEWAGFRCVQR